MTDTELLNTSFPDWNRLPMKFYFSAALAVEEGEQLLSLMAVLNFRNCKKLIDAHREIGLRDHFKSMDDILSQLLVFKQKVVLCLTLVPNLSDISSSEDEGYDFDEVHSLLDGHVLGNDSESDPDDFKLTYEEFSRELNESNFE